jgi:hypothetical protein
MIVSNFCEMKGLDVRGLKKRGTLFHRWPADPLFVYEFPNGDYAYFKCIYNNRTPVCNIKFIFSILLQ